MRERVKIRLPCNLVDWNQGKGLGALADSRNLEATGVRLDVFHRRIGGDSINTSSRGLRWQSLAGTRERVKV
jgi:hypothetical protein